MRTDPLNFPIPAAEADIVTDLIAQSALDEAARAAIVARGTALVKAIRSGAKPGLMEVFLAEYGLSTDEGVALMCLAEALLRVPDASTVDALIEDKISPSDWGTHLGRSSSSLVNASTWALMLTGRVLDEGEPGVAGHLRAAVKRLGEPVIRTAVGRAMKEMGRQFVLGETIQSAMKRGAGMEARGYTYSYDMLGEAARTDADALRYQAAYAAAIEAIGTNCKSDDLRQNPGISVKLSALHPRYEEGQRDRVMRELVPRVGKLARLAARHGMGFNIDAEEQDRLALSRDVIAEVLADPALEGWEGFGVVVQAYGPRAAAAIDWLAETAERLDRRLMVRLVKGAYWDTEIKRAQVFGLDGFPVFSAKTATDISYIANARKLLGLTERLYPQFATHNAHTVAAVLEMAAGLDRDSYEFQRLHGMGEALHDIVLKAEGTHCRIYAPVGAHRDLLAYLVRRLLENGANSSFVNQIVDEEVPAEEVAACPFAAHQPFALPKGPELFLPERRNSVGHDLMARGDFARIDAARGEFTGQEFSAAPRLAVPVQGQEVVPVMNPARTDERVGQVTLASAADVDAALGAARVWDASADDRAAILNRAADAYEANAGEFYAILAREAGKSMPDCEGELREAVDFLRYYAARITTDMTPRGRLVCISPWNFPLAIFIGQIAGALAAGNAVLAKPAEQTPLVADLATRLMLDAGVPPHALQLLPGDGAEVGAALTRDPRVDGVVFTGSTETAQIIRKSMAAHLDPAAPLIAETGGLNAMVVDSTALPEQVVRDVVASAFQSAGQRCSALRCLYVQEDVADHLLQMLYGAMDALEIGDPWQVSTDVGPVIDAEAAAGIRSYVSAARRERRVLHELRAPDQGHFIAPVAIKVSGIEELEREVFGPVLHIARFKVRDLPKVMAAINARGYGLTFGLHTRIDDRVQEIVETMRVGNTYVNRNQIGAVVGSQPFGGEALSGTGPKAGGPEYVARLAMPVAAPEVAVVEQPAANLDAVQQALNAPHRDAALTTRDMSGPTGESNRLSLHPRGPVLCLGPGPEAEAAQVAAIRAFGGVAVAAGGAVPADWLTTASGLSGVLWWGEAAQARQYAQALAVRSGPILPLITTYPDAAHALTERHVCVDTTASGGNAQLLAEVSGA
ncbi:bifunctional proline dehydrogenase/L-glutamate gamma-semialdehyde dehydrogenase PutA [Pararhodobacter oceanensis]|uniref:bifunctional proline dehydrogenase/L-glutamate gamma-semialdehyde dehydrogenase PutA n=1 Tax=Pararhodobacter oceanensis TaxID=2172121 RepID=UPI003A940A3E